MLEREQQLVKKEQDKKREEKDRKKEKKLKKEKERQKLKALSFADEELEEEGRNKVLWRIQNFGRFRSHTRVI